jgi:hypothetical protein
MEQRGYATRLRKRFGKHTSAQAQCHTPKLLSYHVTCIFYVDCATQQKNCVFYVVRAAAI